MMQVQTSLQSLKHVLEDLGPNYEKYVSDELELCEKIQKPLKEMKNKFERDKALKRKQSNLEVFFKII
jgi:hypothetical protein